MSARHLRIAPQWTGELSPEQQTSLIAYCGSHHTHAAKESTFGSYAMKHWWQHEPGSFYVKFQDFGRAMIEAGFELSRCTQNNSWFRVASLHLPIGVRPALGLALRRTLESSPWRVSAAERRAVAAAVPHGYLATGSGSLWRRYCHEARLPIVTIEGSDVRARAPEGELFSSWTMAWAKAQIRCAAALNVSHQEIFALRVPPAMRHHVAASLVRATSIRAVRRVA